MTPMVWHQGIHDRMNMQRMRREGVEGAPGVVPWTIVVSMEQHILKYEFHILKVLKFIEIY